MALKCEKLKRKALATFVFGAALLAGASAHAADYPTAKVMTTGLAVTDKTVTVGILHSVTGTMAISETGSVEAEKPGLFGAIVRLAQRFRLVGLF